MTQNCAQELRPLAARIVCASLWSICRELLANPLVRPISPNDLKKAENQVAFDLHTCEVVANKAAPGLLNNQEAVLRGGVLTG